MKSTPQSSPLLNCSANSEAKGQRYVLLEFKFIQILGENNRNETQTDHLSVDVLTTHFSFVFESIKLHYLYLSPLINWKSILNSPVTVPKFKYTFESF